MSEHALSSPRSRRSLSSPGSADARRPGASRSEAERLRALRRYDVLDTPQEEETFDRITRLATRAFDAPQAMIAFVGADQHWTKSFHSTDGSCAPVAPERAQSFCHYAIRDDDEPLVVEDARQDDRFAEAPFVTGPPHVRFYAGAPLVTPEEEHRIGTLCVLSAQPRTMSADDRAHLKDLAATAMDALESRRRRNGSRASAERFHALVEQASGIISILDPDGTVRYQNPAVERVLGYRPDELAGSDPFDRVHPEDRERVRNEFEELLDEPGGFKSACYRTRHADGSWVHLETMACDLTDDPAVRGVALNSRDVTERKRAEAELRESERQFRQIAETVSEVFWIIDAESHDLLYVSPAFEEVWGRPREQLYENPRAWMEAIHPDDRAHVRRFARAVRQGKSARAARQEKHVSPAEYRIRRPDGTVRWVRDRSFPVIGDDGEPERIVGVAQDITEQKEAEQALRKSEERHRTLVERASDIMTILNPDGTVRYESPSFREVLGHDPEVILGRPVFEGIHPEDRERVRREFAEMEQQPGAVVTIQCRARHADGSWVHLESLVRNLTDDPAIEGFVANTRDVTEREQVRRELRRSEERFRSVVENARDVIFRTDAEGRWTLLSPSWEDTLGYSVEDSLGAPFTEHLHPEEREKMDRSFREKVAARDRDLNSKTRFVTASGETRWIRVSAQLVFDDETGEVTGTTGTFSDVTDSRRFEAERQARERAEELLKAKTSFLNNMSHELRTPLASILGFADVLAEEGEGVQEEFAERIATSGQRLQETLDSVLRLAQFEGGAPEVALQEVTVAEEAEEAVALLQPLAAEKGLALNARCFPGRDDAGQNDAAEARAALDPKALHRILNNLVGNAIKFTEAGGRVTVGVEADARAVRLRVEDTGIGISEEFLPKLFEDFEQESSGLKRTHEGSGLGLAITKRLVETMDGTITVDSTPGEGSVFTVSFPRLAAPVGAEEAAPDDHAAKNAPVAENADAEEAGASGGASSSLPALLVVEDNRNTRMLAEHVLKTRYDVTAVADSETACARAEERSFDAFLLDINLGPDQDGIELLHRLRGDPDHAGAPAVAVTAHAMPGDEQQFREAGFDGYVGKPFDRGELLSALDAALAAEAAEQRG